MSLRVVLPLVLAAVLAPAAGAAQWTGPGAESGLPTDPARPNELRCDPGHNCLLIQTDWQPGNAADAALPYPVSGAFIITEYKVVVGTNNRPGLWTVHPTDPTNYGYTVVDRALGTSAPGDHAISDSPARLKLHQGDTLALDLLDGATVYANAPGEAGTGDIAVLQGDGADTFVAPPHDQATLDFAVKVEPDADGDGYGDDTQDKCPAFAGGYDGCPLGGPPAVPAPPPSPSPPSTPAPAPVAGATKTPLLARARLTSGASRLTYTLNATATHLRARLERRRGAHAWRILSTRAISGAKGTHIVAVPRHRRGDRLVLTTGARAPLKVLALPR